MRILVAEDDVRLAAVLRQSLSEAGWQVDLVHDGRSALQLSLPGADNYDVVLLDRMLPELSGTTVATRLRESGVGTPILMLTARGAIPDRVSGLDAGADDYLSKPFDLDELLARLRALRRRAHGTNDLPIVVGDLVVDPAARRVRRGDAEIGLSAREFDILYLLVARAGRVVGRFTILDEVWDGETDLSSNVIDVHLASIRAKIDRPFGTVTITTVRGTGYRVDHP
jgi:two-component system OmpR family response regulator